MIEHRSHKKQPTSSHIGKIAGLKAYYGISNTIVFEIL